VQGCYTSRLSQSAVHNDLERPSPHDVHYTAVDIQSSSSQNVIIAVSHVLAGTDCCHIAVRGVARSLCRRACRLLVAAIDVTVNILQSLELVVSLGCERVLTSGGESTALEGSATIRKMIEQTAGRLTVVPGQQLYHRRPFNPYWATVCKTVRPVLSYGCLSVCLSVCL